MAEENVFGKMRGRFDEAAAKRCADETISRIMWGFASLSAASPLWLVILASACLWR